MKKILLATILLIVFLLTPSFTFAQGMMGNWINSSPSGTSLDQSAIQNQQNEEQEGKKILDELKNKNITCQKITDSEFEKIGEYFMGQAIGNTAEHIAMNNMMTLMMGQQGEEQMHIILGKRGSGCDTNASYLQNMMGGGMMSMMMGLANSPQVGGGGNPMMGGWNGLGFWGWIPMLLLWIVVFIDLILLGAFLWKQIKKK